jgi:hypothetical protein
VLELDLEGSLFRKEEANVPGRRNNIYHRSVRKKLVRTK